MASAHPVKIGTRGSPLALYQAELIKSEIERVSEGQLTGEIVTFSTKGDQLTTERLINSGGKGLCTPISTSPSSTARSISRVNRPFPPEL
ncbi:MAG: hypothetical protein AAFP24_08140, partial [Pseudomonadota bacterium]